MSDSTQNNELYVFPVLISDFRTAAESWGLSNMCAAWVVIQFVSLATWDKSSASRSLDVSHPVTVWILSVPWHHDIPLSLSFVQLFCYSFLKNCNGASSSWKAKTLILDAIQIEESIIYSFPVSMLYTHKIK